MSDPKPLRAWLLQKHAGVSVRLDAVRQVNVDSLPREVTTWRDFVRALYLPHRLVWRTLAAAWLGLAVFHFTLGRNAPPARESRISPEYAAAWFAQFKSNETFAQISGRP